MVQRAWVLALHVRGLGFILSTAWSLSILGMAPKQKPLNLLKRLFIIKHNPSCTPPSDSLLQYSVIFILFSRDITLWMLLHFLQQSYMCIFSSRVGVGLQLLDRFLSQLRGERRSITSRGRPELVSDFPARTMQVSGQSLLAPVVFYYRLQECVATLKTEAK